MSEAPIQEAIAAFFATPPARCGRITNERSLQLELACFFREQGWDVRFEVPLRADRFEASTLRPKSYLDLLVEIRGQLIGIELKVPMNGQHPETIYSFCADVEFVESIKRANLIQAGFCVMVTDDAAFWKDSGRGSGIHNSFRRVGDRLQGRIIKPTGARDSCVVLDGHYMVAGQWNEVADALMLGGRYLLLGVA